MNLSTPFFRSVATLVAVFCAFSSSVATTCAGDNWPQAAGPNHNWTVRTDERVPLSWSVAKNQNIRWRVKLPETGQSGIAVWEDRLFFSSMKPLSADAKTKKGSDIVVYCADADSGSILWQHLKLAGALRYPVTSGFLHSGSSLSRI